MIFFHFSCQNANERSGQYLDEEFRADKQVTNYIPHLISNTCAIELVLKKRGAIISCLLPADGEQTAASSPNFTKSGSLPFRATLYTGAPMYEPWM